MASGKGRQLLKKKRINSGSYQLRESLILTYSPARGMRRPAKLYGTVRDKSKSHGPADRGYHYDGHAAFPEAKMDSKVSWDGWKDPRASCS